MAAGKIQVSAHTVEYTVKVRELRGPVRVAAAFDITKTKTLPPHEDFVALWDTGATGSVITTNVVNKCGLKPTGRAKVRNVEREYITTVYLISMLLPKRVLLPELRVTEGTLSPGVDVLIGMDVISFGDFVVTNKDGKTCFSFRAPSIERIDFVKQPQQELPQPKPQT